MKDSLRACLFCGSRQPAESVAHIVPESLGGPASPVAHVPSTCDNCNQYFGQKVEAAALRSFPFAGYRMLMSVRSKKGRFVEMQSTQGMIRASGRSGLLDILPRDAEVEARIKSGEVTQLRVCADVTEPLAVCRMLLKIGLEMLAKHHYSVAISARVEAARAFARHPRRGSRWWCAIHADPMQMTAEASTSENSLSVEILEREHCLLTILRLPGVSCLAPLEPAVSPSQVDFNGPYHRLVVAEC